MRHAGRTEAERATIHGLHARARGSLSGALVIRGDPGIDKTALLADAIEGADGMRVPRRRSAPPRPPASSPVDGGSSSITRACARRSPRSATFAERRGAHAALSEALDERRGADRRAWHRAAAATGPDEAVAAERWSATPGARARSGYVAAAAALERAAELSPADGASARRLGAASEETFLAGRFEHALSLAERAVGRSPSSRIRAEAGVYEARSSCCAHAPGRLVMDRRRVARD